MAHFLVVAGMEGEVDKNKSPRAKEVRSFTPVSPPLKRKRRSALYWLKLHDRDFLPPPSFHISPHRENTQLPLLNPEIYRREAFGGLQSLQRAFETAGGLGKLGLSLSSTHKNAAV